MQFDPCSHVVSGVGVGVDVSIGATFSTPPCFCCCWSVSADRKLLSGLVLLPSLVPWLLFLLLLLLLDLASELRLLRQPDVYRYRTKD